MTIFGFPMHQLLAQKSVEFPADPCDQQGPCDAPKEAHDVRVDTSSSCPIPVVKSWLSAPIEQPEHHPLLIPLYEKKKLGSEISCKNLEPEALDESQRSTKGLLNQRRSKNSSDGIDPVTENVFEISTEPIHQWAKSCQIIKS